MTRPEASPDTERSTQPDTESPANDVSPEGESDSELATPDDAGVATNAERTPVEVVPLPETESVTAVVEAYSTAPPSHQAVLQASLGSAMDAAAQANATAAAADAPVVEATVSASDVAPEVQPLSEVGLAHQATELAVVSDPIVEAESVPQPQRFSANDGVVGQVDRLPEDDSRAQAIDGSLDSVATRDPDLETSPGAPPPVPLEDSTDPAQVAEFQSTSTAEAEQARGEATQAILDGPGPEVATAQDMTERRSIDVAPMAPISELAPATEAAEFQELPLTDDVVAQFDTDTAPDMAASMEDARQRARDAEVTRDNERNTAVADARTHTDTEANNAAVGQRNAVGNARRDIQTARQDALDDQAAAVDEIEREATTEGGSARERVDSRVAQDNAEVAEAYADAQTEADEEAARGEREATDASEQARRDADDQSWWDRAVNFVKAAFAKLTEAIGKIFDAVRAAVAGIIDKVRDLAKDIIDAAVTFISTALREFGALLQGLVTNLIGAVFPELARRINAVISVATESLVARVEAVGEELKAGVDAIADGLKSALESILNAFQSALESVVSVVGAVLSGDWSAVLLKVLEAVLKLVGVDPETFYEFIGRARETVGIIVNDPLGFLRNLLGAVVGGVRQFSTNFLTHLQAGVIGWLTSALGGSITLPTEFNLSGVLSVVRQILGLTWDWLRTKAVRLIGEQNVARLEFLFSYVDTLRTDGWEGLYERITGELEGLRDQVLDSLKEMLVTKIVRAGLTWLASVFNPVGAIVKIVTLIWDLYTFLRDQLSRMWAIVESVVNAIGDIARGVLGPAKERVEGVLGNLLPIAIDLIARVAGLGSVAGDVRVIIQRLRERIDRAVDRLLDRVLARFRRGDETEQGDGADDEIGEATPVVDPDGPDHVLRIRDTGSDAVAMLHSDPQPVRDYLDRFESTTLRALSDDDEQVAAAASLRLSRAKLDELDGIADPEAAESRIVALQRQIARHLSVLLGFAVNSASGQFADELGAADAHGRTDLTRVVSHKLAERPELLDRPWSEVLAAVADNDLLTKPLLKSNGFGRNVQEAQGPGEVDTYIKELPDTGLEEAQKAGLEKVNETADSRASFISNRLRRAAHSDNAVRDKLKDRLLDATKDDPLETLKDTIGRALAGATGSTAVDPELKAAVDSAGFIPFLKSMAQGDTVCTITPSSWPTKLEANRDYIDRKFRTVNSPRGGEHEWIPTSLVGQVINHARSSAAAESMPIAAHWIDFHNVLRSPTSGLIFEPRRLSRPIDSRPGDPRHPITYTVLQGHPGAVYAPVSDDGWEASTKQQTIGSTTWHTELADRFTSVAQLDSKSGMEQLIGQVASDFDDLIWNGRGGYAIAAFPSYRAGRNSTVDDHPFRNLHARFTEQREVGERAITAGREVVARLDQ